MDDGGGERVGFEIVDHAQINHRQTSTINLGMAGHCGRGNGFCSVEFQEFIPSG